MKLTTRRLKQIIIEEIEELKHKSGDKQDDPKAKEELEEAEMSLSGTEKQEDKEEEKEEAPSLEERIYKILFNKINGASK